MVVKQGTLIIDNGKVGVIISVYKVGSTTNGDQCATVHWEESYHIFYSDGSFSYLNKSSFDVMLMTGAIRIL
tara:strand:+ start:273 stop:488 length:216 start_codon:yes stop_codon:yes gene_type:complete